jgi:hypothetical protein
VSALPTDTSPLQMISPNNNFLWCVRRLNVQEKNKQSDFRTMRTWWLQTKDMIQYHNGYTMWIVNLEAFQIQIRAYLSKNNSGGKWGALLTN